MTERWTIEDLVAKDKLVSEKKSLKGLIEEVFKLIFTKLYDEMENGRDKSRTLEFCNYGDTDEDLKNNIQELLIWQCALPVYRM